jgi:riboflavin kinase/FMN adenylyltransferase
MPPLEHAGRVISSSRVREALAAGDVDIATALLGRPFDIDGLVVQGDRRGRLLGFPTANLRTPVEALPRDGVYAVHVRVLGEPGGVRMPGVMNIGVRPTFAAGRSIEVHILGDVTHELYGATLRVECAARLRDEAKFDGIDALRAQIGRDVERARAVLGSEGR